MSKVGESTILLEPLFPLSVCLQMGHPQPNFLAFHLFRWLGTPDIKLSFASKTFYCPLIFPPLLLLSDTMLILTLSRIFPDWSWAEKRMLANAAAQQELEGSATGALATLRSYEF